MGVAAIAILSRSDHQVRPPENPKRDLGDLWEAVERDTSGAAATVSDALGLVAPIEVQRNLGYADLGSCGVELIDSRGGVILVVLAGDMSDSRTGHVFLGEHPANPGSDEVAPGSDQERAIATALVLATRDAEPSTKVDAARWMASVLIGRKAD